MYNPYENNNKPSEEQENNSYNNTEQTYQNIYKTQIPDEKPVVVTAEPKRTKKRKKAPVFTKVIAVILLCVLTSVASIEGITYYYQSNGLIVADDSENKEDYVDVTDETDTTEEETADTSEESGSSSILTSTSELTELLSWQEVAELVTPSVVTIQNYQITQTSGYMTGSHTSTEDEFGLAGEGSGVIYTEDGYIVTNAHVVDESDYITVMLWDGTYYEAELIGQDDITDLAVLKINAEGLTACTFGDSDELCVADGVMAIGSPGGSDLSSTVTIGYVSGLNRQISVGDDGYVMTVIQTDAAINPGNSGGALVNQYGEVIGINSSKISDVDYEGLGFAIPISDAITVIYDLMEYGEVVNRAALGITGQYIDEVTASMYSGLSSGVYIASINSQYAIDAGLEVYDVITSIDGVTITSFGTITSMIAAKSPGETVTLVVDRASTGETDIVIEVTLSQATYE